MQSSSPCPAQLLLLSLQYSKVACFCELWDILSFIARSLVVSVLCVFFTGFACELCIGPRLAACLLAYLAKHIAAFHNGFSALPTFQLNSCICRSPTGTEKKYPAFPWNDYFTFPPMSHKTSKVYTHIYSKSTHKFCTVFYSCAHFIDIATSPYKLCCLTAALWCRKHCLLSHQSSVGPVYLSPLDMSWRFSHPRTVAG